MGVVESLRTLWAIPQPEERSSFPTMSFQDYVNLFTFQGHQYGLSGAMPDVPAGDFAGFVQGVHKRNGIVSAAVTARALLISQVRFQWRNNALSQNPGRLFGSRDLAPLERPGSMTRHNLLYTMEEHASYAGNAYVQRDRNRLNLLRPDFVRIVLGSNSDPSYDGDSLIPPSDVEIIGYVYEPHGSGRRGKAEVFLAGEVAHWMPEPDPMCPWRGASWVTSVIREVVGDGQVTDHQSNYFKNAATPNVVVIMREGVTADQTRDYAAIFNEKYSGYQNAYKNWFLGGGQDVKIVGDNLANIGLKDLQGGFETRVASRSRVPAVVLGIREGLGGSALNSGNYVSTRRLWSDGWFSPTVDGLCETFERIVPPPADADLSFDPSRVMFLQEDEQDAAEIVQTQASTIANLVKEGFTADSAKAAVTTGDLNKLEHTGLVSVQLQPPGSEAQPKPFQPTPA